MSYVIVTTIDHESFVSAHGPYDSKEHAAQALETAGWQPIEGSAPNRWTFDGQRWGHEATIEPFDKPLASKPTTQEPPSGEQAA